MQPPPAHRPRLPVAATPCAGLLPGLLSEPALEVVEDATQDPRLAASPLVTDPHAALRCLAAAPLLTTNGAGAYGGRGGGVGPASARGSAP